MSLVSPGYGNCSSVFSGCSYWVVGSVCCVWSVMPRKLPVTLAVKRWAWRVGGIRVHCLPLLWERPLLGRKGFSMSNAIIKQQGDSPVVADNIWEFKLGAGSFILGALAGALVTAGVGRLIAKGELAKPPTPTGWPINFAHRGGAKVVPEDTIEGFREGFSMGGGVVECDVHASAEGTMVVIHDALVDRTTEGTGPVAEKTVPELQSL